MRTYQYNNTQNTEQQISEINMQNTLKLKNLVSTTHLDTFRTKVLRINPFTITNANTVQKLKLSRRFSKCHSTNTTTC